MLVWLFANDVVVDIVVVAAGEGWRGNELEVVVGCRATGGGGIKHAGQ